ncbi:MAG TPA: D-alanyl-D-alanine carboxypeptidase/D-alanyl-D-alanine-endopeptidase [Solirubrobacteraceae bacterium]|jgi:D-alanyl-D-alanine carboxypeptidase/D-alanyl-D-alanine-endopeptidase (penicillin-binding protein 4)
MRRVCVVIALLAGLFASPAPASAVDGEWLRAKLAREMRLAGPGAGAYVVDLAGDRALFGVREDIARPPASVEKLYTTATALLRFGPDATLDTQVLATAAPDFEGLVDGDLWLRGGGDPTLRKVELDVLAAQLAAKGLVGVRGGVAGDGTVFDAFPGSYRTGGRLDTDMGGELAGLAVDRGLVRGRFQRAPALTAARALAAALRRREIRVTGRTHVAAAPAAARTLATISSPPMRVLVGLTNRPSDNLYAESLLKALGARFGAGGTTAAGAGVVSAQLASFGLYPRVFDGSGLARSDRTTPRQVVALLAHMDRTSVATVFRRSLPVPGRTGTLRKRMRWTAAAGRCAAKTGTIRAVSSLAGYCATRDGRRVAFAFLMSGVYVPAARRIQDRMTAALARVTLTD